MMLRLRQICNHPALLAEDSKEQAIIRAEEKEDIKKKVLSTARLIMGVTVRPSLC